MMTIVGVERANFRTKEGADITGYNIYISRPIAPDRGNGDAVERVYMTDRKLEANGIDISKMVGEKVMIYYNRFGKAERIMLES